MLKRPTTILQINFSIYIRGGGRDWKITHLILDCNQISPFSAFFIRCKILTWGRAIQRLCLNFRKGFKHHIHVYLPLISICFTFYSMTHWLPVFLTNPVKAISEEEDNRKAQAQWESFLMGNVMYHQGELLWIWSLASCHRSRGSCHLPAGLLILLSRIARIRKCTYCTHMHTIVYMNNVCLANGNMKM